MIRDGVEEQLRAEYGQDGLVFPAYDSYCFGSVPDTVRQVLDVGGRDGLPGDVFDGVETDVDRVVVVLVDGYGLDSWRRDRDRYEFLDRLTERGTVTPLTSIYPSETAAAITTFETGEPPAIHGRIGWNVYEPQTDRSFLAFSGEVKSGGEGEEIAPEAWNGVDYLYPDLEEAGIDCHSLRPFETPAEGVIQHTYEGLETFGHRLGDAVAASDAPANVYAYVPHVDHAAHYGGTESVGFHDTVEGVCDALTTWIDGVSEDVAEETLLVVTADHGHVNTDPTRNVDLSGFQRLMDSLHRHADGSPVRLAGSPRNVHLHLRDGTVESVRGALSGLDARTFTREEALDRGLFGSGDPTDRFRRRCGDLVLTHRDLGTWYGDVEPDELDLVGMHGGLHPDEMLVPFAAVRADRLR